MSYVVVTNLTKAFDNTPVFANINFTIEKGEFITLLGPSGCGKSTLLRCIAGLNSVNDGRIMVEGEDITDLSPQKRGIGMVFQAYALFPNMTARENIAFGLKIKGMDPVEIDQKVKSVIELVELQGREDHLIDELSGGQRQRVALARALVTRPRILFLDEPLSALDAKIRKRLRYMIRQIQKEMGLTTIFVTHDQEEAMVMSDRIFLMNKGEIVQSGSPDEVYTRPVNEFAAGFMGNYNIIDAARSRDYFGFNGSVKTAVRPEAIFINHPAEGVECTPRAVSGVITFKQLLGNVMRYAVKADGQDFSVDVLNSHAEQYAEGQKVQLYFTKSEINELRA